MRAAFQVRSLPLKSVVPCRLGWDWRPLHAIFTLDPALWFPRHAPRRRTVTPRVLLSTGAWRTARQDCPRPRASATPAATSSATPSVTLLGAQPAADRGYEMNVREAQATKVLRIPALLTPEECGAVLSLAADIQATNAEATLVFADDVQLSQRGNWQTVRERAAAPAHQPRPVHSTCLAIDTSRRPVRACYCRPTFTAAARSGSSFRRVSPEP